MLPSGETFKVSKGAPHIILQLIENDSHLVEVCKLREKPREVSNLLLSPRI